MRHRKVALVLLGTAVVGTWGWFFFRPSPKEHMALFVAELRARGEPVTLEDMEPPMPPEGENGADDLRRAMEWLEDHLADVDDGLEERWETQCAGPWNFRLDRPWHKHATPEQMDEARELLTTVGRLFDAVGAATSKREIAWPLPEDPTDMALCGGGDRYLTWDLVREFLEARSVLATSATDRIRSIEWLLAYDRRSRLRTGMDHLIAAVNRRTDCIVMRDGIEAGRLDAVKLRARVDEFLRGGRVSTMPRALRAERVGYIGIFPSLLDGSKQREANATWRTLDRHLNDREPSATERLGHAMDDAFAGFSFDWRAYLEMLRDLEAAIPERGGELTPANEAALDAHGRKHGIHFRVMLERMRAADAAEALARVALAAAEHRAIHGDWPSTGQDLAPLFADGVPVDPITGSPFVLERTGGHLVLRTPPSDAAAGAGDTLHEAGLEWRLPAR